MSHSSGWALVPSDLILSDFVTATAVTASTDPNIYNVDIKRDWCIGTVPHGGYLMGILTHATSEYMKAQFPDVDQPDMITANFEFLGRSVVGPGRVKLELIKRGRQFSAVRVQLIQGVTKAGSPAVAIEAIFNQGNLAKEEVNKLLSLPTAFKLDSNHLKKHDAETWSDLLIDRRPVLKKIQILSPRLENKGEFPNPSIREQWVSWSPADSPKGFDIAGLAFLCDSFRPLPEQYDLVGNWYPTLNARVEVKRAPPSGGWKWLYMRIEMKVISNGRFDYEVIIFDEEGRVVALSHHTSLIVGGERNAKVKEIKL